MVQEEKVEIILRFGKEEEKVYCLKGEYFCKPILLSNKKRVYPCWRCGYFSKIEEKEWDRYGIGGYVGGLMFEFEKPAIKHLESVTFKCLKFNLQRLIKF
ncbi:MAG: hypothetical protein QXG39_05370 [Candidatus Aenigmatarchaeota archaeon]